MAGAREVDKMAGARVADKTAMWPGVAHCQTWGVAPGLRRAPLGAGGLGRGSSPRLLHPQPTATHQGCTTPSLRLPLPGELLALAPQKAGGTPRPRAGMPHPCPRVRPVLLVPVQRPRRVNLWQDNRCPEWVLPALLTWDWVQSPRSPSTRLAPVPCLQRPLVCPPSGAWISVPIRACLLHNILLLISSSSLPRLQPRRRRQTWLPRPLPQP